MSTMKEKTAINDSETRRRLFLELVKNNRELLTINRIKHISGVTERSIESYLYDGRTPSMFTLYAALKSVIYANGTYTREINNSCNIFEQRWTSCKKHSTSIKPTVIGDRINRKLEYAYNGNIMTIAEISEASGVSHTTCRNRIYKHKPKIGSDITKLIDEKLTKGRKKQ